MLEPIFREAVQRHFAGSPVGVVRDLREYEPAVSQQSVDAVHWWTSPTVHRWQAALGELVDNGQLRACVVEAVPRQLPQVVPVLFARGLDVPPLLAAVPDARSLDHGAGPQSRRTVYCRPESADLIQQLRQGHARTQPQTLSESPLMVALAFSSLFARWEPWFAGASLTDPAARTYSANQPHLELTRPTATRVPLVHRGLKGGSRSHLQASLQACPRARVIFLERRAATEVHRIVSRNYRRSTQRQQELLRGPIAERFPFIARDADVGHLFCIFRRDLRGQQFTVKRAFM